MLHHNFINIDLNLLIDIDDIPSKELDKLEPMNVDYVPWLYERKYGFKNDLTFVDGRGKWLLFFDKSIMNEKWSIVKNLFRNNNFFGIEFIKCSTNYIGENIPNNHLGVISFYSLADHKDVIMNIGSNIITLLNYTTMDTIYYKTDQLTKNGNRINGSIFNYKYKLINHLFTDNLFIDD